MNQITKTFIVNRVCRYLQRLFFALTIAATTSGCSSLINRTVDGMSADLVTAIMDQDDPETVREAVPAYLIMLDSFVQGDPPKTASLRNASTLYAAFGSALVKDETRASKLTSRAWRYGQQALCQDYDVSCEIREVGFEEWETFLTARNTDDAPALYDFATAWLAFLQAHSSDFVTLAELPKAQKLVEILSQINDGYEEVNINLYLGILNSLRPPALGGDFDAAQKYFQQAIDLSEGKDLSVKVSYARFYARTLYERELHDSLLNDVVKADPAEGISTLLNVLAQDEAQALLDTADDYF